MPWTQDDQGESLLRAAMDRLKLWMRTEDVSQSELGRRIGYDQTNISNWFNATPSRGKRQEQRMIPMLKLIRHTNLSADWLMTGEGPMYRERGGLAPGAREVRGALGALAQVEVAVQTIRREYDATLGGVPDDQAAALIRQQQAPPKPKKGSRRARG